MRFLTLILIAMSADAAAAQSTGGALIGRISDEHDKPVARVEVTATHVSTGLTRTVHSRSDGRYRFPSMPTGTYEVAAAHPGYTTVSVRKIDVLLGVARHVDIRIRHVEEEEELTITAPVRVVESGPAIGTIVRRELIADVPLRRRSINEFATLAPLADPRLLRPLDEIVVDGAIAVSDVPLDAVQEMNAMTRQYPAEYGRTSGGVLLVESRTVANEFDGDAFALHREDTHRWTWGAAAGGPIVKDIAHTFTAVERDGDGTRAFATANADLSDRHFIQADYGNERTNGLLRDLWLTNASLWNEFTVRAASRGNEIRESVAGSFAGSSIRHDWTAGAMAIQNGGSGYYAQDQMVVRKLVLNAGVRYDTNAGFSPRVGWTYDVNGSGRNLLRGSVGRYRNPDVTEGSLGYSWQVNPWVALNVDGLHTSGKRDAVAVSGNVMFSTFISLAGSYTYSDRVVADDGARHYAAIAGTLHLPAGFWLSGIGRYRSASPLASRIAGTDLRVARTFGLPHDVSVDAIVDVFNVFAQSRHLPGNHRTQQLGLRVSF